MVRWDPTTGFLGSSPLGPICPKVLHVLAEDAGKDVLWHISQEACEEKSLERRRRLQFWALVAGLTWCCWTGWQGSSGTTDKTPSAWRVPVRANTFGRWATNVATLQVAWWGLLPRLWCYRGKRERNERQLPQALISTEQGYVGNTSRRHLFFLGQGKHNSCGAWW